MNELIQNTNADFYTFKISNFSASRDVISLSADCVELPGCDVVGDTFENLLYSIEDALSRYLNKPNLSIFLKVPKRDWHGNLLTDDMLKVYIED